MNTRKRAIYFDTETTSLNPYNSNAKLIMTQIGREINGDLKIDIDCEWESNEVELISNLDNKLNEIPKYTPVFTYNGLWDILYLLGRCHIMKLNDIYYNLLQLFIGGFKHCDMMQYDNGYFLSMDNVCLSNKIESKCRYNGKDVPILYNKKDYDNIIAHGKDDIERLYRLVNETNLANRYL